ncbi:MAG: hypothetical protein JWN39_98 [Ilumatobacteraceae bacterium]|nr:hypothetical protein [Ilumatobacteraceae bacterium]
MTGGGGGAVAGGEVAGGAVSGGAVGAGAVCGGAVCGAAVCGGAVVAGAVSATVAAGAAAAGGAAGGAVAGAAVDAVGAGVPAAGVVVRGLIVVDGATGIVGTAVVASVEPVPGTLVSGASVAVSTGTVSRLDVVATNPNWCAVAPRTGSVGGGTTDATTVGSGVAVVVAATGVSCSGSACGAEAFGAGRLAIAIAPVKPITAVAARPVAARRLPVAGWRRRPPTLSSRRRCSAAKRSAWAAVWFTPGFEGRVLARCSASRCTFGHRHVGSRT